MLTLEGQKHLPGDAAVAEVAGRAGAEFDDVLGFGEVHLEQRPDTGGEREQVERRLGGFRGWAGRDPCAGGVGGFDGGQEIRAAIGFNEDVYVAVLILGA